MNEGVGSADRTPDLTFFWEEIMSIIEMAKKYARLDAVCVQHGLTLTEYQILTCAMDGQMTDVEIRHELIVTHEQFDQIVKRLRARDLIGRRKGVLIAGIEGRSAYYDVPKMSA